MKTEFITTETKDILNWLPVRKNERDTNKNKFGHVIVFAGSRGFTGAAILVAEATQRSGAGLVTIAIPEDLENSIVSRLSPVIMTCGLSGSYSASLNSHLVEAAIALTENATVAALGPGIGLGIDVSEFVRQFVERCTLPIVIDADALTLLANMTDHGQSLIRSRKSKTILTPHPAELARLLGTTADVIQSDRISAINEAVKMYGCVVLLKGFQTLISDPGEKIYLNTTGNPGLSSAGSGDVLTGVTAGFLAQNLSALQAAAAAAFVHGFAADLIAVKNGGTTGMIATDVITYLPNAISDCQITSANLRMPTNNNRILGGFMQTQTNATTPTTLKNASAGLQACIQNCLESSQICIRTIDHCLSKGGQHAEPKHIKLMQDCADMCQLSANFMLRNSDFHLSICKTCAEICTACAENCESMTDSDTEMKACAEACKKSARSCSEMAKMQ